jgi:hypothetical protein
MIRMNRHAPRLATVAYERSAPARTGLEDIRDAGPWHGVETDTWLATLLRGAIAPARLEADPARSAADAEATGRRGRIVR